MTKLLHIDTQTRVITRYEGRVPTHRIKWMDGPIPEDDLNNFLILPDDFIEGKAQ